MWGGGCEKRDHNGRIDRASKRLKRETFELDGCMRLSL